MFGDNDPYVTVPNSVWEQVHHAVRDAVATVLHGPCGDQMCECTENPSDPAHTLYLVAVEAAEEAFSIDNFDLSYSEKLARVTDRTLAAAAESYERTLAKSRTSQER